MSVRSRRKPDLTWTAVNVVVERKARVRFDIFGDWSIPLGMWFFVTTLGREAANLPRPKGLVARIGGGLLQPVACKLIDFL